MQLFVGNQHALDTDHNYFIGRVFFCTKQVSDKGLVFLKAAGWMSSYGGLKYFQEKIWGSEIFSEKIWGFEKFIENNMGA